MKIGRRMKQDLVIGYQSIHEMLEDQGYTTLRMWDGKVSGLPMVLKELEDFESRDKIQDIVILPQNLADCGRTQKKGSDENPRHFVYIKFK